MKTVIELLMDAPDNAVGNIRNVLKSVAEGNWIGAYNTLAWEAECGDTQWHKDCSELADDFWKESESLV